MKKPVFKFLLLLSSAYFTFPAQASELNAEWISTNRTDEWHLPQNWSGGIVPNDTATDKFSVTIGPASDWRQVVVSLPVAVSGLELSGSDLFSRSQPFDVLENFSWSAGTLEGIFHLSGNALFHGSSFKTLHGNIVMNGTAEWTDGFLIWEHYGTVEINPGAIFRISAAGHLGSEINTSSVLLTNRGTIEVNAPGKSPTFYSELANNGLLDIRAGNLQSRAAYSGTGLVQIAENSRIYFHRGASLDGGTFLNNGEIHLAGAGVRSNVFLPGPVFLTGGVTGDAELSVEDMTWTHGDMSAPGLTHIVQNGTLRVRNFPLNSRPFFNEGRLIVESGTFRIHGGAVFTNSSTGVVELRSQTAFVGEGAGALVNLGTILKDDDVGAAAVRFLLSGSGLVQARKGTLSINGGGSGFGELGNTDGLFEVDAGATLELENLDFSPASRLAGTGHLQLANSIFQGSIDSNLSLAISGVDLTNLQPFAISELHLGTANDFHGDLTIDVLQELRLIGNLQAAAVRSLNHTEIAPIDEVVELSAGARLELNGVTRWHYGGILASEGSEIVNAGEMRVLGNTALRLRTNSVLRNTGAWIANTDIEKLSLSLGVNAVLTSVPTSHNPFPAPGPFRIAGPVTLSSTRLEAAPGAIVSLADFGATNAAVTLHSSQFTVSNRLHTVNTAFNLSNAVIEVPGDWTGSASFQGAGHIDGSLNLSAMELIARETNQIALRGSLQFAPGGSLKVSFVDAVVSNSPPILSATEPVTLPAQFILADNPVRTTNDVSPIIILESQQPIAGAFTNCASGAVLSSTNAIRYRLFYGIGSPYGSNRLVMVQAATPFEDWLTQRFSPDDLNNAEISGPASDPDKNGLSNLAEFVLGASPATNSNAADLLSIEPTEDGYTLVRVFQRREIGDLRVRIAASQDLKTWIDTALGSTSPQFQLHRAFDVNGRDCFLYLYPSVPDHFFIRIQAETTPSP